ncbi:Homeodomain-like transcriptional regulator isoform 2 [Hibiscus syriacus]|uniref:Homeodomain-like transcriptional regulator isoform 2 n=1 Tax=Hibiscus syriacus TaxID=106335 RepID=A0A6A3A724_HIBSY|nr:homeobox-DDT domain protein RLT3-like [Hibiscus syriacus]XP_039005778.1 homeobox-DDT domain protein RLT3-like [Hibiscus syriacus]XP_039005779.1 homeobox-DDT domain protein RLT3-like [Hibiscus syriacus]KAE8699577.1 Homeodomain-like transcriptional regulator isoform 2 [Hibiscus syriacus]
MKRKTQLQLAELEDLYKDKIFLTQEEMGDYALNLGLTLKQVQQWFINKRKRHKGTILPIRSMKKPSASTKGNVTGIFAPSENHKSTSLVIVNGFGKKKKKLLLPQDLLPAQFILKKVFRKDGPPLGVEFESLPSQAFFHCKGSKESHLADQECERGAAKRRKNNCNEKAPMKKHGIGKGLMTAWRVVNPEGGYIPTGVDFSNREIGAPQTSSAVRRQPPRNKRRQPLVSQMKQRSLEKKLQEKKRTSIKRREAYTVQSNKNVNQMQPRKEKCELALDGTVSNECLDQLAMLADDEELELRELQAGPNPLSCADHLGRSGLLGCSLCKDLLAKFPPSSVKMKLPFSMQPWNSSPKTVKKLFKVFHFLYTYSVTLDICSFTLDEFAQAFHDKDSMLLGKIHVSLLKLLLSDVQAELSGAVLPHFSLSCKFLSLLQSVENQEFVVDFWKTSLNPLTWTEILRQVLVAAGFGSKQGLLRREAFSKEMDLMVRFGLRPGSLKCELFKILSLRGNNGQKVSDLALSLTVIELNLTSTTEELEELICSTLSSDITLFEKISSSAYRLRCSSVAKDNNDCRSDTKDSGSVDDDSDDSSDDSECDSGNYYQRKIKHDNRFKSKNNMLAVYTEIDESHSGEVWLVGLMEDEYSDLSIEEKLNALVALMDLLSTGSSIRMENPSKAIVEFIPSIPRYGSGEKIKRSSTQQNFPRPSWVYGGQEPHTPSDSSPVDSSAVTKLFEKEKCSSSGKDAKQTEVGVYIHPMQSVFLGSDRRYNRYWLFLGPCNGYDPGHGRIYFESSEDGHWEVIDTEEALLSLLAVLDDRGKREALLIEALEKRETSLRQEMSSRHLCGAEIGHMQSGSPEMDATRENSCSPVSDVDNLSLTVAVTESLTSCSAIVLHAGKKGEEQKQMWKRLQEFDVWIWNYFYLNLNAVKHKRSYLDSLTRCESCHDLYWRDEKHCRVCHTTFEIDFDLEERYAIHVATCREGDKTTFLNFKVLPSQLQSLKAAVHAIESFMPKVALVGAWTKSAHRLWVKRLRRTSSLSELLQVVTDFVAAINENWWNQCHIEQEGCTIIKEIIAFFPTMPQTSSALALWLVKLDEFIASYLKKVHSEGN